MSWQKVKLGDVCDFVTGKTPPTLESRYFDGDVLWITPSDFVAKNIDKTCRTLSDLAILDNKCKFLPKDTVVLSCIGDIGKVGILSSGGTTNQQITAILPNELFNSSFLYYLLMCKRNELNSLANSAVVPILNNANLKRLEIPLPPIEVQQKIADILDKADGLRRKDAELIKKYDELAQSIFIDMFGDPVTNPKGIKYVKLKNLYNEGVKCGPFGSALKKEEYVGYGVPVWVMDNIVNYKFDQRNCLFITNDKYKELSAYKVSNGDVIISRAGTVGKMCVMNYDQKDSIISTNLIRLSINQKCLNSYFFVFFMKYFSIVAGRLKTGNDGSFTHMNTDVLDNMQIFLPEILKQNEFIRTLNILEQMKKLNLHNSEQLFQSLLQRAFNGELVH